MLWYSGLIERCGSDMSKTHEIIKFIDSLDFSKNAQIVADYKSKYGVGGHIIDGKYVLITSHSVEHYLNETNNVKHKLDGPAEIIHYEIYINNKKSDHSYSEWWFNGKCCTIDFFKWCFENAINASSPSPDEINLIKLTWADYGK